MPFEHEPLRIRSAPAGLRRISSGIASLPRSCRLAASRISSISSVRQAELSAISPASSATRSEWLPVYASRESTARASEAAARKRAARSTPLATLSELRQLRDIRAGEPHLVLAVLLRPVERAVGEADQRVALATVLRVGGDAGADGDRTDRAEIGFADAGDDRLGDRERDLLVGPGKQHGELVAAEAERLAALAQPRRDEREDAVAGRMAEAVVDPLEVVDVEEAERDERRRPRPRAPSRAGAARGSAGGCRGRSADRSARGASR